MELSLKNMKKFINENRKTIDRIFHLQKENMRFLNFNKKQNILEIDRLEKKLMKENNIKTADLSFIFSIYKVVGRKEKC